MAHREPGRVGTLLVLSALLVGLETGACGSAAVWPNPDWLVARSPEAVRMSSARLAELKRWLQEKAGARPYGTVVIRFGRIAFEDYGGGATRESKWEIGSIRKSVASSLLGIAIKERRLSLDTVVYKVWPDIYTITGREKDKRITVRQLASATSGWMSGDRPGTRWRYHNRAFTACHMVIGRAYRQPQDQVAALVEKRIKAKIGATSWNVYHFPDSFTSRAGPKLAVDSTVRDLSRYGYLWLREGRWKKQQIVPRSYVLKARQNQVAKHGGHYGLLWFTNDGQVLLPDVPADAYYHIGFGKGNRRTVLVVCPSLDLVAVVGTHASAYNMGREYKEQPVGTVNEWMGRVVASVQGGGRKKHARTKRSGRR